MVNVNLGSFDFSFIEKQDVSYLDELLLDEKGNLKILSYEDLKEVPQTHLTTFCVKKGFYSIPTKELISFIYEEIKEDYISTIEIGSGNGTIAKSLGIKGTDNYLQHRPEVKAHYELLQQTIVPYGENVEKLDALAAVRKYQPENVIAAWVTHKYNPDQHWRGGSEFGVNEETLLSNINKYIFVGNKHVHSKKPLLELKHREIKEPWILSRSQHSDDNFIAIWENE
ncbi:hypothetical protein AAGG74_17570 [Bacillus mexicanus]|uniref:hypothetical protein n=1 Tax=Bacillus mexicanus TaxID=2834415 RepID=UPI003D1A8ED5